MQSNWTPCGNRLHPPCEEVEGANASYWHIVSFCCAAEFVRYRRIEDSDNPFPRKIYGSTLWLRHALFGESLVERTKIDHDSLVASLADLLCAVACRHFEVNSLSVDADDLGRRAYLAAYWRGREVLYIHCDTDGAFAGVEKRLDGIERRVLHDQNHNGRRKHLRQHGVLEPIGKVFRGYAQCRRSCGSQRNLLHLFVLDLDSPGSLPIDVGPVYTTPAPGKKRNHRGQQEFLQVRHAAAADRHDPRLGQAPGRSGAGGPRGRCRGRGHRRARDRRCGSRLWLARQGALVEGQEPALAAGASGGAGGRLLLSRAGQPLGERHELP